MVDLYVYYKVREQDAEALEKLVRAMQAGLGIAAQLKRRPQAQDGLQTWMEIYPGTAAAFADALQQAARAAGLESLIEGPRRIEIFTDLTPCA